MPSDSEILIKISTDIANAMSGFTNLVGQMTEMTAAVKNIGETSEQSGQQSQTFFEAWTSGIDGSAAASTAWGVTASKAFEQVGEVLGTIAGAFPAMVSAAANAGDEMFTLSSRLNTSVESLSELKYITESAGGNMEALAKTVQGLGTTLADSGSKGAAGIQALGLSLEDLQQMDPADAFFAITEQLQKTIPDASERATAAMQIFGQRFGQNTVLLNEDLAGLRENFKQLDGAMSSDFAAASDRYNDAWHDIEVTQNKFKQDVAGAVLPVLADLLEQFPKLGGAAVTLGGGLFSMGEQLVPLGANIALLASSGLGPWLKTTAMALPGVTTAVNALGISFTGLTAALGPLAIAIAGIAAAWLAWRAANQESGWVRAISDKFEYASLRLQGFSAAEADATIKAEHARQKANELEAATKTVGDAAAKTGAQIRTQKDGFADLAKETEKNKAALAGLTDAQKAQIASAIAHGQSLSHIAETTKVSAGALELFAKQLDATKKASESSPLGKFTKEMQDFGPSVAAAVKSGAPMADMVAQFGKHAADLVAKAKLIPGAFAAVPEAVKQIATAFTDAAFQKAMADFEKKTGDIADLWKNALPDAIMQVDRDLMATLGSITSMQDQLATHAMSGSQQRMAAIDKEEAAAVAAAKKRLTAGTELSQRELDLIHQTYDDKRKVEQKYTGDVMRDAEMRGYKSKQELEKIAGIERQVLADMTAVHGDFTDAEIAAQQQVVDTAEVAAGKVKTDWTGALDALAASFAQLAQISGGTFGGMLKGMGEVVGQAHLIKTGLGSAFGKDGFGGIGAAFSASKGAASGLGGLLKGIGGSIPLIGTAISGVMAAATAAVQIGKKLHDAFTKSGGEKAAAEIGRDFGVTITEEMGNAIAKTAKDQFKGDRFAAELFHMADVVKAAGGITEQNVGKMTSKLRDVFVLVEKGSFTTAQATKVLDENFGAIAAHVLASGKVASREFTDLLQLQQHFGTQSKQITDFVGSQTSRLGTSLGTLATTMENNGDSVARFERLAVAGFNAALQSGVSYTDAIASLGPALDQIVAKNKSLGREGGAAVQELLKFREVATAHADLVASAGSLNDVMLAMSNIGALNADTMADLEAQGAQTFQQLTAAGFTEQQSLQQMQGFLEQTRTAHKELGLPIDENTQKLIAQAEAQGVLKAEQLSTNDIMLQGLGAIIEAVGGTLPAAWKTAEGAAVDSAKTVGATMNATVNAALTDQEKKLQQNKWANYATDADRAARKAKDSLGKVDGTLGDVSDALDDTDWDGWAEDAVDAAKDVQEAVDGVSLGHSPGGLKEIPLKLAAAQAAFKVWERTGVTSATNVQSAIDGMRGREVGMAGIRGVPTPLEMQDPVRQFVPPPLADEARSETVNLHFTINSLDPAGVELVTERKILPAMVKILRRGRNLADLQTAMNVVVKGG